MKIAGHPEYRGGFRETVNGVVVEVGMGDQRQVALYLGELTGEPVKILLVPVGVGNYPNAAGRPIINYVYEMIRPATLSPDAANSDMAPALQIGRMAVPADQEDQWNHWYNTVYTANYEKVPGCIRARRFRAVRGEPKYSVVYEFENDKVSETAEWLKQRDINPDNEKMRSMMTHAPGSPGVWVKTFQL